MATRRSSAALLTTAALLLAGLAVAIGTLVRSPTESGGEHMHPAAHVEVDLYSGRPNPHFSLQPADAGELMSRVAALPPTDDKPPSTPLGYRGLRVVTDQSGSVSEIRVYQGVVTVQQPDGTESTLSDPNRDTERWLIDLGTADLDKEELTYLHNELGR